MRIAGNLVLAGLFAGLIATIGWGGHATAQDLSALSPERRVIMQSNRGSSLALLGAANLGWIADAKRAAGTLVANAKRLAGMWPKGSGGGTTLANPAIWENMGDFKAKLAAFQSAAENALAKANANDRAGLAAAAGGVIDACDACHLSYRGR